MPSVVISKLGKFAIVALSITGTSLLIANILSSSFKKTDKVTTDNLSNLDLSKSSPSPEELTTTPAQTTNNSYSRDTTSIISSSSLEPTPLTQHKKCKVFLTSEDEKYKVLACHDTQIRRSEIWYLYDIKNHILEQIDGLTSKNDTNNKSLGDKDLYWKDKQWQGYRGKNNYKYWDKEIIGSPFTIKYVFSNDSFKFPFFDYLSFFCRGPQLYKDRQIFQFSNTNCTYFDIPADHLISNHSIQPHLESSFGEPKEQCYIGRPKPKWKRWTLVEELTNCVSSPN